MTKFYFVRHGEPMWSLCEEYKLKGHGRDLVPLTQQGIHQAKEAAKDKRLMEAELIIASPYTRALQTAAILSRKLDLDIQVEFDLREWQPDLTFLYDTADTLTELYKDYEKHQGVYPPGEEKLWESKESLHQRVSRVLDKYLSYKCIIVVAHGMAFKTQRPEEEMAFCGIVEYER